MVFIVGFGVDIGEEKIELVDKKGVVKVINEVKFRGIDWFVMVSVFGVDFELKEWLDFMKYYYEAKVVVDNYFIFFGLNYIIFKLGCLINDSGEGKVDIGECM